MTWFYMDYGIKLIIKTHSLSLLILYLSTIHLLIIIIQKRSDKWADIARYNYGRASLLPISTKIINGTHAHTGGGVGGVGL